MAGYARRTKVSEQTLYEVLGVADDASADEIRRAHRTILRENHPDVARHPDAERLDAAQKAWAVLKVPADRERYDRHLEAERVAARRAETPSAAAAADRRRAAPRPTGDSAGGAAPGGQARTAAATGVSGTGPRLFDDTDETAWDWRAPATERTAARRTRHSPPSLPGGRWFDRPTRWAWITGLAAAIIVGYATGADEWTLVGVYLVFTLIGFAPTRLAIALTLVASILWAALVLQAFGVTQRSGLAVAVLCGAAVLAAATARRGVARPLRHLLARVLQPAARQRQADPLDSPVIRVGDTLTDPDARDVLSVFARAFAAADGVRLFVRPNQPSTEASLQFVLVAGRHVFPIAVPRLDAGPVHFDGTAIFHGPDQRAAVYNRLPQQTRQLRTQIGTQTRRVHPIILLPYLGQTIPVTDLGPFVAGSLGPIIDHIGTTAASTGSGRGGGLRAVQRPVVEAVAAALTTMP